MNNFHCKSCGSRNGALILDLGVQPLANNLLFESNLSDGGEPKHPLRLAVCLDCRLMQLPEIIPPTKLFSEYIYFSSFSDAMLQHAKSATDEYIKDFDLGKECQVVEVASNDGYMLQYFVRSGIPALGIEPAVNIAEEARKKGVETVSEFFTLNLADRLATEKGQADLILGNNVFAHVPDTNDFVAAIAALLKKQGRVVLEFPWGHEMIRNLEFDTIYHEHVFYFNLTPLMPLFARHGLEIIKVQKLPIHGGSLRVFASHAGQFAVDPSVKVTLEQEADEGVKTADYYTDFAESVLMLKDELVKLLADLKSNGSSIAAYGASAKGSTLLNFCGVGLETLDFVADRSTYKQGRYTPGRHLPIVSPEDLLEKQPDYALLLTWNFADEILKQQEEFRKRGGKFIIPLPKARVV
jgi:SAM-dependent methyltransferase